MSAPGRTSFRWPLVVSYRGFEIGRHGRGGRVNNYGQLNVNSWTTSFMWPLVIIIPLELKSDGTVVAVGQNDSGELNVSSWTNIVQVAAGVIIQWD